MMRLKAPVELVVAADSESMLIVRLTAAGVLARAGSTLDRMDNLKSAVEEACTCLIQQTNPPERMMLQFACEGENFVFSVRGMEGAYPCGDMDETETEVVRCILQGVADDVDLDVQNGHLQSVKLRAALN